MKSRSSGYIKGFEEPREEIIALPSILNAQTYHDFQLEAEGLQNRSRYHEVPTGILPRI
jgi:hypothetical protein